MKTSRLEIKEHYPLKELTTFNIGGPARYFAVITTEDEAQEALSFAAKYSADLFILGGGSNILISDDGFPGLVILNRIKGLAHRIHNEKVTVTAGAGEDWDAFTKLCVDNNWQGAECLSGVPGTVGAAPVQNIGAYGQSADDIVDEVHAFDARTGEKTLFTKETCRFAYRKSIFNSTAAGRYLITRVAFTLNRNAPPHITYHDLKNHFAGATGVTLSQVREAVLTIRNTKGLLVLDGYDRLKSAGSFFKNPIISSEHYEHLKAALRNTESPQNWAWPQASGEVKVSAAFLIQSAGFMRGYRKGNVGISPRHTLAIVNYDAATAEEVIVFARRVQERVKGEFGILLAPEVQLIGKTPPLLQS
ncbi:MAG: UDP-N-acetylmuramate dehydrogenase [Nitrospirota bacterium]